MPKPSWLERSSAGACGPPRDQRPYGIHIRERGLRNSSGLEWGAADRRRAGTPPDRLAGDQQAVQDTCRLFHKLWRSL